MKKWIFGVFILGLIIGIFDFVSASDNQVEVDFFYSRTCSHCVQESKFLNELEKKYPEVKINKLLVSERKNVELLKKLYQDHKVPPEEQGYVPITFFDNRYFLGFDKEIGKEIENCVLESIEEDSRKDCGCERCLAEKPIEEVSTPIDLEGKVKIPIIGEIDIKKYSLPTLAILLGALDGFNICSLGALILILGLVLALKSKKKVLIFGGLFIFTTAIVYGILIVLWYQIFSFFLPYLKAMEILIGLLAIAGGIYFLRQFIKYRKQGPTCEITTGKQMMSKFSSKFQASLRDSGNIFLLIGMVLLFAGIITIVEFPCSAAVPIVFAGVLAGSELPAFSYLFYIALFILFYMLDEIIIFLIAFFTMTIWLASSKAITWITLAEAIILFILGFYYLFGFGVLL